MAQLLPYLRYMINAADIPLTPDEPLKEVYMIVRPEEKYDLEAALRTVMAPVYSTMNGLGRGGRGGLAYASQQKRGPFRWFRKPELSVLLPKTVFFFVIPESRVQQVIEAAGAVLRAKGGPGDCGLGVAIVGDIEADVVIGPTAPEKYKKSESPGFDEGPP